MRVMLLALTTFMAGCAFLTLPTAALAYPVYPWCTDISGFQGGATNCYFSTWDQCMQAARGNGGICYQNPFYGAPGYSATEARPRRRARGN